MTPRLDPVALMSELARTGGDRCLLCGRRPFKLGVWVPTPACSRELGAPPGKVRCVAYTLCKKCVGRPGSLTLAEEKILRGHRTALAAPEAN